MGEGELQETTDEELQKCREFFVTQGPVEKEEKEICKPVESVHRNVVHLRTPQKSIRKQKDTPQL